MPTLYIDHSILTHLPSWGPLEDVLKGGKRMRTASVTGQVHPKVRSKAEAAISSDMISAMRDWHRACHRADN
jgi:hypothetical protein